jgi:L-ascorbate metabolism protein UlaG (beta-lactamase superfamily)
MRFTYFGHSCFLLETMGVKVLVDPFFSSNPLAAGAKIFSGDVDADWILVSHGHFDHVEDAAAVAVRTGARVAACFEVTEWLRARGVAGECLEPMNVGGAIRTPFGRLRYTVAEHSSTLPDGTSGGVAGGFLIENGEGTFFYSGDTALTREFRTLGELYRIDVAALCLGDRFTMGPAEAAVAARWLRCLRVIGVHYDTWSPIALNRDEAGQVFGEAGVELMLPGVGESLDLG